MSCSAMAISSSSNLCLGLVSALPGRVAALVGALATRAMSASPFHIGDGTSELPGLGFETRHPFRVLAPFGLGKLADYPTVRGSHVVEADSYRQLLGQMIVNACPWVCPPSSKQV